MWELRCEGRRVRGKRKQRGLKAESQGRSCCLSCTITPSRLSHSLVRSCTRKESPEASPDMQVRCSNQRGDTDQGPDLKRCLGPATTPSLLASTHMYELHGDNFLNPEVELLEAGERLFAQKALDQIRDDQYFKWASARGSFLSLPP
jgi:hypothetical protein